MSTAASAASRLGPSLLLLLLAGGGAVLVGMAASLSAGYALLLLLAPAVGAAVVWRPALGLLLLALMIPIENLTVVTSGLTGARVFGAVVFAAWVAHKLIWRSSWGHLLRSGLVWVGGAFVLLIVASTQWAWVPQAAIDGIPQMVMLLALGLLGFDLMRSWGTVDGLVRALLVGGAIAAGATLWQYFAENLRRAGDDVAGGVNGTAVILVSLIPFGFYLARSPAPLRWRLFGVAYVALACVSVTLTFSRMNLLVLPLLLLLMAWDAWRAKVGRGLLLGVGAVAIVAALLLAPWERIGQRASTILPYIAASFGSSAENPISSGRGYHLRAGLAIAADYPVLGVGYDNYGHLFLREYQFTVAGSDRLYYSPRSPHSSHVGILADLGVVGLSLWLILLFGVGVREGVRAWRATAADPHGRPHLLSRAVVYSLLLHATVYGLYLPNQKEKFLWLLLAMAAAAGSLARERVADRGAAADPAHLRGP